MMRLLITAILVASAAAVLVSRTSSGNTSPSDSTSPTVIAITGATLVDGSGRAPLRDSVVIIRGDLIEAVGKRNQIRVPDDASVIQARGLVVAPGFIDTHNHSDR